MTDQVVPPPPVRPLGQRLFDLVVWGGVFVLLAVSFGPVELWRMPKLFANSENMREFASAYGHPDFTEWRTYVGQMWLTVQMALWGTVGAILIAVPLGLAAARRSEEHTSELQSRP